MSEENRKVTWRPWLWLITFIGVSVPCRLRADWRQEWEAELRCHETQLAQWDKLTWRTKLDLLWHSLGALMDALWMQPRRLEDEMIQDLRYGWRMLRKRKGFTAAAVLSLALGIGVNTAIFSVVDSILLRPLPYPGAERLVKMSATNISQKQQWEGWNRAGVSLADFREWQGESRSFEEMALYSSGGAYRLTEADGQKNLIGSRVSLNFFSFLGAQAALGRTFQPDDQRPESERVLVLSHAYWVERYKADPNVLGQKLVLNEQPHTIVGVLAAGFRDYFSYSSDSNRERWAPLRVYAPTPVQAWLPINVTHEAVTWHGWGGNRQGSYRVLARLKPGVTMEQAQTEMSAIAGRMEQRYPESNKNLGAAVFNLHEEVTGSSRRKMLLLLVTFSMVLLIACANVASLLLARGIERAKEMAIRTTLGAGRLRVLRQLLTECLLLAGLGGAIATLLAVGMVAGIRPLIPSDIPRSDAVTLDYRTLLFTAGLTVLTTLLFGLLPVWQTAKLNLTEELKDAGRSATESRRSRWWRHALVVSQVALTMILLVGAGLMTRSFLRIYRAEIGYSTHNLARLHVPPPYAFEPGRAVERARRVVPNEEDIEEWTRYWNPLLEGARKLPGIENAAFTTGSPLEGTGTMTHMSIPGYASADPKRPLIGNGEVVSPDYFQVLNLNLLQGRLFTADDRSDAQSVIIVNESFARTYFPGQSAAGQTIKFHPSSKFDQSVTIVGVVADTRVRLDRQIEPHYYQPVAQMPLRGLNLLIRTSGDPAQPFDALSKLVRAMNPYRPIEKPAKLDEVRAGYTIKPRFYLALLGSLAGLALLLSVIGIYGVFFLSVSQRTHEIGIRRALGAQDRDVLKLVLKQGMLLSLMGQAAGLIGALALTRFVSGWLFEVSATDPVTFIAVAGLLTLVVLLACYAPARRAVRVDPLVSLRHE
jgi:predicted permease